ncbi:TPA: hypothetical protein ACIUMO_004440, partial [Salmonella enterica subsp. enterica serovar Oranienburg]
DFITITIAPSKFQYYYTRVFSFSITAKEVHHDTLFSERTLQTFPGLIFSYCSGLVCHFLIF